MIKKIILVSVFSCFILISAFASEVTNIPTQKNSVSFSFGNGYNFQSVERYAEGDNIGDDANSSTRGRGFDIFAKKIAPYEKLFLNTAIGTTAGFGGLFIFGIILSSAGYAMTMDLTSDYWTGVYVGYAGNAILGFSWLFFVAAAVNWSLWGVIQYAKKKGVVVTAFAEYDTLGISIKL